MRRVTANGYGVTMLNFTWGLCSWKILKFRGICLPFYVLENSLLQTITFSLISHGCPSCLPMARTDTDLPHSYFLPRKWSLNCLFPLIAQNKMLINQTLYKILSFLQAPPWSLTHSAWASTQQLRRPGQLQGKTFSNLLCYHATLSSTPSTWFFLPLSTPLYKRKLLLVQPLGHLQILGSQCSLHYKWPLSPDCNSLFLPMQ